MFSCCWNAKENFTLQLHRATPDIDGSCIHRRGEKLKYLTCLHNIFGGYTTVKYSAVDIFPVKTDRPSWKRLRMCVLPPVPTFFRVAFYHKNCIQEGSYCLNYKVNSNTNGFSKPEIFWTVDKRFSFIILNARVKLWPCNHFLRVSSSVWSQKNDYNFVELFQNGTK